MIVRIEPSQVSALRANLSLNMNVPPVTFLVRRRSAGYLLR